MDLQISGKAFIVTGGTAGLGFATVECLVSEGANVLVTGRTEGKFVAAQRALGRHSDKIAFLAGDNADPALPERLRRIVIERWGRLDGLLVSVGGPPPGKALTTDDDTWRLSFESVFLGAVRLVRDLSAVMTDGGAIVLVVAPSAKVADPMMTISNGLRPGLALLAKNFADELGSRNIRVNALWPGLFATDRVKRPLENRTPDTSAVALKRLGDPAEFGRIATVILSPVASFVTGAAIGIDGGLVKVL
jgi:3-oxoacyl-[acyl-carrier protein] reductase